MLTQPPTSLNAAVPGRQFPAGLEAALMRGLERDPNRRQPTVLEFAAAVDVGSRGGPAQGTAGGLFGVLKSLIRKK